MKSLLKNYLYPVATISGSIIGVGFLSLPYLAVNVGMGTMLIYLVVLAALVTTIHVIFGQVSLKTPDFKRWPGFVEYYFGKNAKKYISVTLILGSFGTMLAYLIVGGSFLANILQPAFGGTELVYVLIYFAAASALIFFGVKLISKFEFWSLCLLGAIFVFIFLQGFSQIKTSNFFLDPLADSGSWRTLFLPFGAIIFSLWGTGLIPEVEEMVRGHKRSLKSIIIAATIVPAVLYLLFILLVVGISGSQTTESALVGLREFLRGPFISVVLFIGVMTTFTACITQGLLLKKVFMYDFKLKESAAWAATCFPSLILFLLGVNSFVALISLLGGFFLSIDGILILWMYKKIGGKAYVVYPLSLVFVLAIAYEIIFVFL